MSAYAMSTPDGQAEQKIFNNYERIIEIHFVPNITQLPCVTLTNVDEPFDYQGGFSKILQFSSFYRAYYKLNNGEFIECYNNHLFDEIGKYQLKLVYKLDTNIEVYYNFGIYGIWC